LAYKIKTLWGVNKLKEICKKINTKDIGKEEIRVGKTKKIKSPKAL